MEQIAWLKANKINPAILIRKGFDAEFERFKNNFNKQDKNKIPF